MARQRIFTPSQTPRQVPSRIPSRAPNRATAGGALDAARAVLATPSLQSALREAVQRGVVSQLPPWMRGLVQQAIDGRLQPSAFLGRMGRDFLGALEEIARQGQGRGGSVAPGTRGPGNRGGGRIPPRPPAPPTQPPDVPPAGEPARPIPPGRERTRGSLPEPPLPGEDGRNPLSQEILTPQSSNVYSFAYDGSTSTLYVTYKANKLNPSGVRSRAGRYQGRTELHGHSGHTMGGKTNARGAMYAYLDVPARVFDRMQLAQSKGRFVWDELRIRGTVYGHRYRYRLAQGSIITQKGLSGVYVPRRATQRGFVNRSLADSGTGRRGFTQSTIPARQFARGRGRDSMVFPQRGGL